MEYVTILSYLMFFIFALSLSVYNLLYSYRVNGASQKLGIGLPRVLKRILDLNNFFSLILTLAIAFFFTITLLTLRLPGF